MEEKIKYAKTLLDNNLLSFNHNSSSIEGQLIMEIFEQFHNYEMNVPTALEILEDVKNLILLTSSIN